MSAPNNEGLNQAEGTDNKSIMDQLTELEVEGKLENLSKQDALDMSKTIQELMKKLATSDDSGYDAQQLIRINSRILSRIVETMDVVDDCGNEFGVKELASKAATIMNNEHHLEELEKINFLGEDKCYHHNPISTNLDIEEDYGVEVKKRVQSQKRRQFFKVVEPEEVAVVQEDSVGEPSLILRVIMKVYAENGNEPIKYFKLVLNPDSFSATIENMFYLSFLLKDGFVRFVTIDDDVFIKPVLEDKSRGDKCDNTKFSNIFSISKTQWAELVESHQIEEAMLPLLI